MSRVRTWRRRLQGAYRPPTDTIFTRHTDSYRQAVHLVTLYYIVSLYKLLNVVLYNWPRWSQLTHADVNHLWPVRWMTWFDSPHYALNFIAGSALISTLLTLLHPRSRLLRCSFALSLTWIYAFKFSFGKIDHNMHLWITCAWLFVLLPKGQWQPTLTTRIQRHLFLTVFTAAQGMALLFYTLSGWLKINGAIKQWAAGEIHLFHPDAMALQIATTLQKTDTISILGGVLIEHSIIGWMLYMAATFLELSAFFIWFRPALHRLWGISFILMHIGNALILSILFPENILLLALLLVYSPLRPRQHSWRALWQALPFPRIKPKPTTS